MPQPLFIHSTRSMTYSPESSKDRISERDSSDDECDGMSFAQLPSSRLKSIQHSGAESQKSCIATLDQLLEMDERDKEKTAAWEAATLNANSAETDQAGSSAFSRESKENEASEWMRQRNATRRFGDDRTNIQPFASTQAQSSKKPLERNSSATKTAQMANTKRSGIGQSKPNTASSKRVQLKGSIAAHDEPSVGTAELRAKAKAEPAEYQTAYHPCCYYSTKCLFGDMSIRLERGTNFFSNVRWVIDPTLPRATIFDDFFEEHSDIVLFIHQAYLESCSLGGTNNWKLTQAALNRRDNEQTLLEGDKERIEWYSAWLKAGSLHNKKLSEAAKRRRESRAQLPGDREMLEKIDKAAKAGGQATREKKDEEAGRTSNTMFVCIRCAERDKVTYRMLPKSENTHSQRLLKGLPLVDYKQGTAKCEECRIRNPDESNQHALWAAVEKDEEETVKARMFPKRIRTTIISRMCEREGCSSVQYTSSRGKTYSHCQKHQYPGKRKS
mmetsp:Transcript_9674/g.14628  ORF Transcript_9674/g.14628 Transcript_9674/m.14628 type:complete len:500 (+) Transcript_9674:328-1827(+)